MERFRVSQGEHWSREYLIEAEDLADAKAKYDEYVRTGEEGDDIYMFDPEYIADIETDRVWYGEQGNILESTE